MRHLNLLFFRPHRPGAHLSGDLSKWTAHRHCRYPLCLPTAAAGPIVGGSRTLFERFRRKKDKGSTDADSEVTTTVPPPDPDVGWLDEQAPRSEESINRLRDRSGLPPHLRAELAGEGMQPFKFVWQYNAEFARKQYAIYGKASGLKPGIAWPRREELEYQQGYEKIFHPPLESLLEGAKARRAAKLKEIEDRENEIVKNLAKLPQWKREFFEKFTERKTVQDAELATKQKLIDEVREYLGYSVDVADPRFQEALLRKEEEKVVGAKAISKTKLRQAKILEELAALAAEEMNKVQKPQETSEKTPPGESQKKNETT